MLIEQPPALWRRLVPHALWRGSAAGEKVVFLTFDDGPIPATTPFVLDTLRARGIRATFFMVGENAVRYPDLVAAIRAEGHDIGNHTYNHLSALHHSPAAYMANIRLCDAVLHTPLFRPPHGLLPLPHARQVAKDYTIVMWDVVPRDYSARLTAEAVFRKVVRYTRPGSILTFHDSLRSIDKLREVLPLCLDWLSDEGYSFALLR